MAIEVRPVGPEGADELVAVHRAAYLRRPSDVDGAVLAASADLGRAFGTYEDGRLVAVARSFATTVTVPGGVQVPAASVCNVAVLATHRRRGLSAMAMDALLADVAARREPVALLVPSEWGIYGRWGFGPATSWARWEVDLPAPLRPDLVAERVELVEPGQLRSLGPAAFARHHAATVGTIDREPTWWGTRYGDAGKFAVVHRDPAGEVDGWAVYGGTVKWDHGRPDGDLVVDEMISDGPVAWQALWAHVLGVDLVRTVSAWVRPVDEPVPLVLADGRQARLAGQSDHVWARLLDVPVALGARVAAGPAEVALEVVAPDGGAERFRVRSAAGGCFEVERVGVEPDLTVTSGALGGAYLGGTDLRSFAWAGLVAEHRPGSLDALAAAMAWSPAPWCSTGF